MRNPTEIRRRNFQAVARLSGSFELGFNGSVGVGVTPVAAFIWNVLPTDGGGGGGGGGGDLDMFLPNVWVTS